MKKMARARKHCLLQNARYDRMCQRHTEWAPYISTETKTIESIKWFITTLLLESNDLYEHITETQLRRMPMVQKELTRCATDIYNEVYRNDRSKKFVVMDLGNEHLDGRVGSILSYDRIKSIFHVVIHPKRYGDAKRDHKMVLKPENMRMLYSPNSKRGHNPLPKVESTTVSFENYFIAKDKTDNHENASIEIEFIANVFDNLRLIHQYPELQSVQARESFRRIVQEREAELEQRQSIIDMQTVHFQASYQYMTLMHTHRQEQPNKRRRLGRCMPNGNHAQQVTDVWNARCDYMHQLANSTTTGSDEHVFTLPFKTTDGSLFEASSLLTTFESYPDIRNAEIRLANDMASDEIIINRNSVESLFPGIDIDEDILNTCLRW